MVVHLRIGAEVEQEDVVRVSWLRWLVVVVWTFCSKVQKEKKFARF